MAVFLYITDMVISRDQQKKNHDCLVLFAFFVCVPRLYSEGASPMMTEPDLVDLVGGPQPVNRSL